MLAQLESVGAVICAAGDGLAPADKKLYALRDVTGTVEAIPLIASSIMSQEDRRGHRLAGARRQGRHRRLHEGRSTAPASSPRPWSALGTDAGVRTVALLTDMSTPLGLTAGNAIEVAESVEVLAGGGPADVVELTLALAREMLAGAGRTDVDPADRLADGSAMDAWKAMIRAQGGDPDAPLPTARESHVVDAPADRHADPARRDGGRPGRVAARRRPGPQGGPRPGRRRRGLARPPRRRGHRGPAAVHAAHRRAGAVRARPRRRSRAAYDVGDAGVVRARRRW